MKTTETYPTRGGRYKVTSYEKKYADMVRSDDIHALIYALMIGASHETKSVLNVLSKEIVRKSKRAEIL